MNFHHMPELQGRHSYVILVLAVSGLSLGLDCIVFFPLRPGDPAARADPAAQADGGSARLCARRATGDRELHRADRLGEEMWQEAGVGRVIEVIETVVRGRRKSSGTLGIR